MRSQSKHSDAATRDEPPVPLVVDLDGTLIRTDVLWESVVQLWRRPGVAVRALLALLLRGKAGFKTVLAGEITIDPATLPYREDVLEFVRSQHEIGRDVILATATHRIMAQRVADHLGMFCRVFATEDGVNLSGDHKRAALESSYGRRGFDYVGDDQKDLTILSAARKALLVDPSQSLLKRASAAGNVLRVFSENRSAVEIIARALRLPQWAKNVLLAVPLLTAHMVSNLEAWISVGIAFLGFSLVASATYLVNDLVDLQSDRIHAQKRFRPLASGRLAIRTALILAVALGSLGFVLSIVFLPSAFLAYLIAYTVLTLAYSFDLKRRLLVDALALAALYTLRILAGGAAIGVVVSEWLLMFALFIFISLAFLKRAVELQASEAGGRLSGRSYSPVDLETIRVIGMSSGLCSVLVLSLYINSPAVSQLYRSPQILWLMCPLLIYWISRMWFLAARGQVTQDPVVFTLLDWRSYIVGACSLLIVSFATLGPAGMRW
jgi:4-hydroxybenzoate polyprenyltransferase/phosphoserine phosphatase